MNKKYLGLILGIFLFGIIFCLVSAEPVIVKYNVTFGAECYSNSSNISTIKVKDEKSNWEFEFTESFEKSIEFEFIRDFGNKTLTAQVAEALNNYLYYFNNTGTLQDRWINLMENESLRNKCPDCNCNFKEKEERGYVGYILCFIVGVVVTLGVIYFMKKQKEKPAKASEEISD